eukprot:scaffold445767_cov18-Prasinocladus_malaysianus.AAC.1
MQCSGAAATLFETSDMSSRDEAAKANRDGQSVQSDHSYEYKLASPSRVYEYDVRWSEYEPRTSTA